jgi:hypothetical protein
MRGAENEDIMAWAQAELMRLADKPMAPVVDEGEKGDGGDDGEVAAIKENRS